MFSSTAFRNEGSMWIRGSRDSIYRQHIYIGSGNLVPWWKPRFVIRKVFIVMGKPFLSTLTWDLMSHMILKLGDTKLIFQSHSFRQQILLFWKINSAFFKISPWSLLFPFPFPAIWAVVMCTNYILPMCMVFNLKTVLYVIFLASGKTIKTSMEYSKCNTF